MPLQSKFKFLALSSILVERDARQRRAIDVSDLLVSIARRGIMNPLIVEPQGDGQFRLVAGERRYEAARQLDLPEVPVRLTTDLTPIEFAIMEFEENEKRQDLTWQDKAKAIHKIHHLLLAENPDQSIAETAEGLGLTRGNVYIQITIVPWFGKSPEVDRAATLAEAYNWLTRKRAREQGQALEELIGAGPDLGASLMTFEEHVEAMNGGANGTEPQDVPLPLDGVKEPVTELYLPLQGQEFDISKSLRIPPVPMPSGIICGDTMKWWANYSGPKFNLIHCDFPYGVNLGNGPQGREGGNASGTGNLAYDDSPQAAEALFDSFLRNLDKFTAFSAHLVFWFGGQHRRMWEDKFRAANTGFVFYPHPLIWHKTDNVGISADTSRRPRHTYEQAFLASRGDRKLVCVRADSYAAPTDKSLHHSAKPEPVLRHFFQMLVDETTSIFDPTCGAASALRAAESLGAKHSFGIELDPKNAEIAQFALKRFRLAREAEKVAREAEKRKEQSNG